MDVLQRDFSAISEYYHHLGQDPSHYDTSNDICTPMGCVKEMVDEIPEELWHRPNLKVLDCCCGNGNFHAYIQKKTSIKNLYFNEINQRRIDNVLRIFGSDINVTKRNFLAFNEDEEFDLVVSNPPYARFNNGVRVSKNHNLSRAFILKALNVTKKGGYILFICPNNWMSFSDRNQVARKLSQYQFIYLNIGEAKKWFPQVGSSFTWFLLKKVPNKAPFRIRSHYTIKDDQSAIIDKNVSFIPLYYSNIVRRIFSETIHSHKPKYKIQTSSDLHRHTKKALLRDEESKAYPYKVIHTPKKVLWSRRPHKWQNTWKVFISLTDHYGCFVDQCGATQSIAFVQCASEKEAHTIKKQLESEVFLFLNNVTRYGNFNNIRVLQQFPLLHTIALNKEQKAFIQRFNDLYYKRNGAIW